MTGNVDARTKLNVPSEFSVAETVPVPLAPVKAPVPLTILKSSVDGKPSDAAWDL
jgi:hypothetical protein